MNTFKIRILEPFLKIIKDNVSLNNDNSFCSFYCPSNQILLKIFKIRRNPMRFLKDPNWYPLSKFFIDNLESDYKVTVEYYGKPIINVNFSSYSINTTLEIYKDHYQVTCMLQGISKDYKTTGKNAYKRLLEELRKDYALIGDSI